MQTKLIDPFGRPIEYVRLSVTDRCDLRCSYCMPRGFRGFEVPEHWLTFDEIERVIGAFGRLGVSRIRLTGGEPLVRNDLPDLAGYAVDKGMRAVISTNGTLISAKLAQTLKRIGLSYVGISLDGLEVRGAEESLELIRAALSGETGDRAERARAVVALNAGAALYVAGLQPGVKEGVAQAMALMQTGAPWAKVEALAELTSTM